MDGENQYHAIFTQGHPCVIVHPSTLAPPLIALGAIAEVVGPKGKRDDRASRSSTRLPPNETQREHTLAPNEILVAVKFGSSAPQFARFTNASYEVRQKQSYDWPLVQAAVAFHLDKAASWPRACAMVLGHVAPTPLVSEAAAKALEGKEITEATASAAGEAAVEGAKPLSQNAYKVQAGQGRRQARRRSPPPARRSTGRRRHDGASAAPRTALHSPALEGDGRPRRGLPPEHQRGTRRRRQLLVRPQRPLARPR